MKELNITYENQNRQIKEQNSRLLELHKELKIKAYELEKEKQNAEELTKVKGIASIETNFALGRVKTKNNLPLIS